MLELVSVVVQHNTSNPTLMATVTGTESAEHLGTAMLEQLAEVDVRDMSPETSRTFLQLGLTASHQKRLDDLSAKARQGTLTPDEGRELDESIHVGNLLAILHSKARQALKRAGLSS